IDRLDLERISQASANQRTGRAGRTSPGACVRLYSEKDFHTWPAFDAPEVKRVDLCQALLAVHQWGKSDAREFGWVEMAEEAMLAAAGRLLRMLGALEKSGALAAAGERLARLPVHPRLGRLLIAADHLHQREAAAAMAALLGERDILLPEQGGRDDIATRAVQTDSDLLLRMDRLHEAEQARFGWHLRDRGIDVVAARQVARARDQLIN